MLPSITFSSIAWNELQQLSEEAYPFEGCGLLLGPYQSDKQVHKIKSLYNTLRDQGRGRFDFLFSADEFMKAQMAAERENLDIVGIYHTHPDHPPKPSPTDTNQPMLSGWISVIASVHGGKFKEAKSWWRDQDQDPFQETQLCIEDKKIV